MITFDDAAKADFDTGLGIPRWPTQSTQHTPGQCTAVQNWAILIRGQGNRGNNPCRGKT